MYAIRSYYAYELIATFGLDQTRDFLLREVPFGSDGGDDRERYRHCCSDA